MVSKILILFELKRRPGSHLLEQKYTDCMLFIENPLTGTLDQNYLSRRDQCNLSYIITARPKALISLFKRE